MSRKSALGIGRNGERIISIAGQKALALDSAMCIIPAMRNHSQIVKAAPTRREIADKCGVSIHAVGSWMTRNSIPAEHFKVFADEGWATLEELAIGAARSAPVPALSSSAGA